MQKEVYSFKGAGKVFCLITKRDLFISIIIILDHMFIFSYRLKDDSFTEDDDPKNTKIQENQMLISKEQAKKWIEEEKIKFLLSAWGLKEPVLYGWLNFHNEGEFFFIELVENQDQVSLKYPLNESTEKNLWVYAGHIDGNERLKSLIGEKVRFEFTISSDKYQEKHDNPLLIKADDKTIDKFINVHVSTQVFDSNGNLLLPQTIYKHYLDEKKSEIEVDVNKERIYLEAQNYSLKKEITKKQEEQNDLEIKIEVLKSDSTILENHINQEQSKLESIMQAQKKIIEFLKGKPETYHKLGFISDDVYDDLRGKVHIEDDRSEEEKNTTLDFKTDLKKDISLLSKYIQTYLHSKGIIYPLYIITEFLILLNTNDLIILSGLSGSGKTNLVKSVAKAIHAKAHIISVKPNWTGAEDLIGFYNPLQQRFIQTPFLNAIIQAHKDPDHLHLILLDEMNLARPEYYFADFLSQLEDKKNPKIPLYSEEEASHLETDFKNFLELLNTATHKKLDEFTSFGQLLSNSDINAKLQSMMGNIGKKSILEYQGWLSRMLSGILNIPSELKIPPNVRFLGAINVDETTHYLSPKIIDRTFIVKFTSPLKYDFEYIKKEVTQNSVDPAIVHTKPEDFSRNTSEYPEYKAEHPVAKYLTTISTDFLEGFGADLGYRSIRQALLFDEITKEVYHHLNADVRNALSLNNILRFKIFPRLSFDGNVEKVFPGSTDKIKRNNKMDIFRSHVDDILKPLNLPEHTYSDSRKELRQIIETARANDDIYNYWT